MKSQIALAVGAGYLLGRTHKLRWALTLGAAAAGGRLGRVPGQLVRRGAESMSDSAGQGKGSAGIGKVAGMTGPLVDAGKSAATTAIVSRIESLTERVRGEAEASESERRSAEDEDDDRELESRRDRPAGRHESDAESEEDFDENGDAPPVRRRDSSARQTDDDSFDEDIDGDRYDGDDSRQAARGSRASNGRRATGDDERRTRERGDDAEQPVVRRRPPRNATSERRPARERARQA